MDGVLAILKDHDFDRTPQHGIDLLLRAAAVLHREEIRAVNILDKLKARDNTQRDCELCGREFTAQSSLRKHVSSVHLGEKPSQCSECGAKFTRPSGLKYHLKLHRNVYDFSCECGSQFRKKQHYLTHRKKCSAAVAVSAPSSPSPVVSPSICPVVSGTVRTFLSLMGTVGTQ